MHFEAGDADDLVRQIRWMGEHPDEILAIRLAARKEYLLKYTGERNYLELRAIYDPVLKSMKGSVLESLPRRRLSKKDERPEDGEVPRGRCYWFDWDGFCFMVQF